MRLPNSRHSEFPKAFKLVCTLALFTGCASPLVEYGIISGEDKSGKTKFNLAESVVTFKYATNAAGRPDESRIEIASVPVPNEEWLYSIEGTTYYENWGVDTDLQVTYRNDTKLIQELGIEITDRRPELIEGLAQAVATGGNLLSRGIPTLNLSAESELPEGIVISDFLDEVSNSTCKNSGLQHKPNEDLSKPINPNGGISCVDYLFDGNDQFTANLTIGSVPLDAFKRSTLTNNLKSNSYYYAACRTFSIDLKRKEDGRIFSTSLVVADPRWLQSLKFPDKGKIAVQPSCGANSVASDAKLPTGMDYINALLKAAKSIKGDSSEDEGEGSEDEPTNGGN